jgi:hypothetical protein
VLSLIFIFGSSAALVFRLCGLPTGVKPIATEIALSEYDRWENRYHASEYIFGKQPNNFLTSCKALLRKSGKALAVADCEGRKQLQYGTGGAKEVEKLYTRPMLEEEFSGLHDVQIVEQELELNEGASHAGLSAVIGMTAWK